MGSIKYRAMAPSPGERGPARSAQGGDRGARSLRAFAAKAERDRSTPEALARLLERAADGDRQAIELVFDQHLAMVLRHADRLGEASALSEDELVQEGSLALVGAIREYAAEHRGRPGAAAGFAAYADEKVGQAMAGAADAQAAAERDQRQLIEDAEAYERAEISIRRDKKREAANAELAEKLEWSPEKTRILGEIVAGARRIHDEELMHYVDPDELTELGDE